MDSAVLAITPTGSIRDAPDSTPSRRKSLKSLFGSMRSNRRNNSHTTELGASPTTTQSPQSPSRRKSNWNLFGSVRNHDSKENLNNEQDHDGLDNCLANNVASPQNSDGGPGVKRKKSFAGVFGTISPRRSIRRRRSKFEHCIQSEKSSGTDKTATQSPDLVPLPQEHKDEGNVTDANSPECCRQLHSSNEGEESADFWGVAMERHLYECKLKQPEVVRHIEVKSMGDSLNNSSPAPEKESEADCSGLKSSDAKFISRPKTRSHRAPNIIMSHHFEIYQDESGNSSANLVEIGNNSEVDTDLEEPLELQVGARTPNSYLQELITSSDIHSNDFLRKIDNELSRTPSPHLKEIQFSLSPSPDKLKPAQPNDFLKDVSPEVLKGSKELLATAFSKENSGGCSESPSENNKINNDSISGLHSLPLTSYHTSYNQSDPNPSFETDIAELERVIELGTQAMNLARLTRTIRPSIQSQKKNHNSFIQGFPDVVLEQSLALRNSDPAESSSTAVDEGEICSDLENMSEISTPIGVRHRKSPHLVTGKQVFDTMRRRHSLNPIRVIVAQNSHGATQSKFYPSISAARADLLCNDEFRSLDSWIYDPKERAFRLSHANDMGTSLDPVTDAQRYWNIMNIPSVLTDFDSTSETDLDLDLEADFQGNEGDSGEILWNRDPSKVNEGSSTPYEADDEEDLSDFICEPSMDFSRLESKSAESIDWVFKSGPRFGLDRRDFSGKMFTEDVLLNLEDANSAQPTSGPTRTWFDLGKDHNKFQEGGNESEGEGTFIDHQSRSFPRKHFVSLGGASNDVDHVKDNWADIASDEDYQNLDSTRVLCGNDATIFQAGKSQTSPRIFLWKRKSASQLRAKYVTYRKHITKKPVPTDIGCASTKNRTSQNPFERTRNLGNPVSFKIDELTAEEISQDCIYGRRGSYSSDSFYAKLDPEEAEMNRDIATRYCKTPEEEMERALTPEFDSSYANMSIGLSSISLLNMEEPITSASFSYRNGTKSLHAEDPKDHRSISLSSSTSSLSFPRYNSFLELSARVQTPKATTNCDFSPEPKLIADQTFGLSLNHDDSDETSDEERKGYSIDNIESFTTLDFDPTYGFPQYDRCVSQSESSTLSIQTDVAGASIASEAHSWTADSWFSRDEQSTSKFESSEGFGVFSDVPGSYLDHEDGFGNSLALREMITIQGAENEDTKEYIEIEKVPKRAQNNVTLQDFNLRPVGKALHQSRLPRHKSLRKGPVNISQSFTIKQHQSPRPGILRPQGTVLPLANRKNLLARSPRLMTPSGAVYMPADECDAFRLSDAETDESSEFGEPLQKVENHI